MVYGTSLFSEFFAQADILEEDWPPIKQGMFNGSYERYQTIKTETDNFLKNIHV